METKKVIQYQGVHATFYYENGEFIHQDKNGHDVTTYDTANEGLLADVKHLCEGEYDTERITIIDLVIPD